jgi:hypothetical protein
MINDSATLQGGGLQELAAADALGCRVRATKVERRGIRPAGAYSTAGMDTLHTCRRLRHSPGQSGIVKSTLASEHTQEPENTDANPRRMTIPSHLRACELDMAQAGRRRPALARTDVQLPVSKARLRA